MNINIYGQLFNLAIFTLTGFIIGIFFDIFRIIRKSFKTPDFITYIEDIIFWILTGLILLFSIFTFNNGEIRIYIFASLVFGLIIYLFTISKYFVKISVTILTTIKNILYYPIKLIIKFTRKFIFRPFFVVFINIKKKTSKLIKNSNKKAKNKKIFNIYNKIDE